MLRMRTHVVADHREGKPMGAEALVIGYGSRLRRDDAVGLEVAEQVEARGLPDVRVITAHQLVPELAEALSDARVAVFVDARVAGGAEGLGVSQGAGRAGGVEVSVVVPAADGGAFAHASSPGGLLALAAAVYGRVPTKCWLVTIAVSDLSLGEGLSVATSALVGEAVGIVEGLVQ